MTTRMHTLLAGAAAVVLAALTSGSTVRSQEPEPTSGYGIGSPDTFVTKYVAFRDERLRRADPQVLRIGLGYVKGLSRSFTSMAGELAVDLESGAYTIRLRRLTPGETYSVWLVGEADGDGTQPVLDVAYRLATLTPAGASGLVNGVLSMDDPAMPSGFTMDRVVVVPGVASAAGPLASGSVNVFQKIFLRRLTLVDRSAGAILFEETTPAPALAGLVPGFALESPSALADGSAAPVPLDKLISRGARLFFEGTFGGNGRTCGTCHPASNNFTIDPEFIGRLPASDPLFVAEFIPALAQLERPELMRRFGLILENVDGLEDPTNKFVMRGVPHTLGLQVSLERDSALAGAPVQMTGWSGDGAPGAGSLRDFAAGAVTQHFTRRLERVVGRDFRLPTERQLDALEAFQLSLGRFTDFDLSTIAFLDPDVVAGQSLFVNGTGDPNAGGTCAFCHGNAGALAINLENRNFNTNVEDIFHPARLIEAFPLDGGFGRIANADGTFGDRSFNTASVVEAADTAPFFHNNVVATLEGVVDFYSGPEFNTPRAPAARFSFNQTQRNQIADFMRGVNTLQNIDGARRELREFVVRRESLLRDQEARLRAAFEETRDAIEVLREGSLFPEAVTRLRSARTCIVQAQASYDPDERRQLAKLAAAALARAREAVATVAP